MTKLVCRGRRGRREWLAPEGTHFITVDLEVYSKTRLRGLIEALGAKVLVLHEGRWGPRYLASVELGRSWQLSADQEIRRLVRLVRSLPRQAQRLWDGAQSRVFDIGIQAATTPRSHALKLSADTVASVASVRGRITVTTYAPEGEPTVGRPASKTKPPNKRMNLTKRGVPVGDA